MAEHLEKKRKIGDDHEIPETTHEVRLKAVPVGELNLERDFEVVETKIPELKDGEVLIKPLYWSVDPYMRPKMRGIKTYTDPYRVGETLFGSAVAKVVKSEHKEYQVGDLVDGWFHWADYSVVSSSNPNNVIVTKLPADEDLLGVQTAWGLTGLTAYVGLLTVGQLKSGSVVLVSGAAGATGSFVGQIAKIKGCKVIGIVGKAEKIDHIKKLGFDEAVNYKSPTYVEDLKEACKGGIDYYFDNVGGQTLDLAYDLINPHGTIICCGAIAEYNSASPPQGPRHEWQIVTKKLTVKGFIYNQHREVFEEATKEIKQWVKEGKLKYEVTLRHGLKNIGSALAELFKGENVGKMLVKAD